MSWLGLEGHDAIADRFRGTLRAGRLASSYLFVGPEGCGKRSFAIRLAQGLLCERMPPEQLAPCGECESCQQITAGTHPDLLSVARPADRKDIPIQLLIGDAEHRGRVGLCHDLALKPFKGNRRIAVIDDADFLNEEGANSLLKTLEEPPPRSLLILVGTSAEKQLPTIRSRCQMIRFRPLPVDVAAGLLVSTGAVDSIEQAAPLARCAEGSLAQAKRLADPELWIFRSELFRALARLPLEAVRFSRAITASVESVGKDAPLRRARAKLLIGFSIDYYHALLRAFVAAEGGATEIEGLPVGDSELQKAVAAGLESFRGDTEEIARAIERCLEAANHVERNANLATMVECWIADLADLSKQPAVY